MTTTVPDTTDSQLTEAEQLGNGLRALAAFVEANPGLASDLKYTFRAANVPHIESRGEPREYLAKWARAAARAGVEVKKSYDEKWGSIDLAFGPLVGLHVYADRDEVCERLVIGTREVTEEVPDPDALAAVPMVTVTRTVEDVEWRCSPLLAGAS